MIRETIVTSLSPEGTPHIAPMGVHVLPGELLIMPFRPSTTLDNLLSSGYAVVNYCDDVRVFAGCLTGRRHWPLVEAERIPGKRLADTLAHAELALTRVEPDPLRPRLHCRVVHQAQHAPFRGFNRGQFAVLEAAILVSRLDRLPWDKVERELAYLRIGLDKTAGPAEREAWDWLMERVEAFRRERPEDPP
ncbi:DUF447 domain-containing protein [Candidatus Methylocalor cossyra]|uniref:Tetrahydromethanopterin synthesis protein n=1 Tax=Candidatus Methylocalor cossyra TaxID=3108543 RepID=A0ABM9NI95_9GAMM